MFLGAAVHLLLDYSDWFLWFSYYSQRVPSLLLAPLILKKGGDVEKKLDKLGRECAICGFDKAWDSHLILGYREVMLCPNHHFMVHKGIISEKKILSILKKKR